MSSGLPARAVDFNDVLKYGSSVVDPNFKRDRDAKTDARSTVTYQAYSVKDYQAVKQKMQDPRFKEMPKSLGPGGDEKWAAAQDRKAKQQEYAGKLRDMNKKFGVMTSDGSPAKGTTAKFGVDAASEGGASSGLIHMTRQ